MKVTVRKRGHWWVAEIPSLAVTRPDGQPPIMPQCHASTRSAAITGVLEIATIWPETSNTNQADKPSAATMDPM